MLPCLKVAYSYNILSSSSIPVFSLHDITHNVVLCMSCTYF